MLSFAMRRSGVRIPSAPPASPNVFRGFHISASKKLGKKAWQHQVLAMATLKPFPESKLQEVYEWHPKSRLHAQKQRNGQILFILEVGKSSDGKRIRHSLGTNPEWAEEERGRVDQIIKKRTPLAPNSEAADDAGSYHDYRWCLAALRPANASLREAVEFYLKHSSPTKGVITIKQGQDILLEKLTRLKRRKPHLRNMKYASDQMIKKFGDVPRVDVTKEMAGAFLYGNPGWKDRTQNDIRNWCRTFFNQLSKEQFYSKELNPFAKVDLIRATRTVKIRDSILSVSETWAWLKYLYQSEEFEVLFHQVAVLFCGFRSEEALSITWANLEFEEERIGIDEDVSKGWRVRRHKMPPVAAAWMRVLYKQTNGNWPNWKQGKNGGLDQRLKRSRIKFREYVKADADLSKDEDIKGELTQNYARHTFASYGWHYFGPVECAEMMGHQDGAGILLKRHYRELTSELEAQAFFSLAPVIDGEALLRRHDRPVEKIVVNVPDLTTLLE